MSFPDIFRRRRVGLQGHKQVIVKVVSRGFALWFGAEYGLTPLSKFKATKGRA
jgi:hypothetical protein